MSGNIDNDQRTVASAKVYPMDLAPHKITILKSNNADPKVTPTIGAQSKQSLSSGPVITHTGLNLVRTTQVITHNNQLLATNLSANANSLTITSVQQPVNVSATISTQTPSVINTSTQSNIQIKGNQNSVLATQVVSQGSQNVNLAQARNARTLPANVRLLAPIPHYSAKQVNSQMTAKMITPVAIQTSPSHIPTNLSTGVNLSTAGTGHVPRGLVAGANLAIPRAKSSHGGGGWNTSLLRNAATYPVRLRGRNPSPITHTAVTAIPLISTLVTHASTSGIITSVGRARIPYSSSQLISGHGKPMNDRPTSQAEYAGVTITPTPITTATSQPSYSRGTTLLQRNYQNVKFSTVRTTSSTVRPINPAATCTITMHSMTQPINQSLLMSAALQSSHSSAGNHQSQHIGQWQPANLSVHNRGGPRTQLLVYHKREEERAPIFHYGVMCSQGYKHSQADQHTPLQLTTHHESRAMNRPSILRKRDSEGVPVRYARRSRTPPNYARAPSPWGAVMAEARQRRNSDGGSTTISAASSAGASREPSPQLVEPVRQVDKIVPRKKPRKQAINEIRHCDTSSAEDAVPYTTTQTEASNSTSAMLTEPESPKPTAPKRSLLAADCSDGWRGTALHFVRPSDVQPRPRRVPHLTQLASRRNVLEHADGWKIHHLTAQMDDLTHEESDMISQWEGVLTSLEKLTCKKPPPNSELAAQLDTAIDLLKGTVQRSRIACESMTEARADVLKIFKHRALVGDIITRQGDKRCFRKHTS